MVSPCQSSRFLEPTLLTNFTKQQYAQGNKSPTLAQREGTYSQCIKVISIDLRPSKISWCHPCQARVLWQSLYSSLFLIQMWDVIRKQRFEAIFLISFPSCCWTISIIIIYRHVCIFWSILTPSWGSHCVAPVVAAVFFWWFSHFLRLPPARSSLLPAVATDKSQRGSWASPLCSRASVYCTFSVSYKKSSNIHVCMQKIISRLLLNSNIRIPTPQLWRLWLSWKFLNFLTRIDWQLTSRPKCSWKSETNFWLSLLQNHLRLTSWLHSVLLPKV